MVDINNNDKSFTLQKGYDLSATKLTSAEQTAAENKAVQQKAFEDSNYKTTSGGIIVEKSHGKKAIEELKEQAEAAKPKELSPREQTQVFMKALKEKLEKEHGSTRLSIGDSVRQITGTTAAMVVQDVVMKIARQGTKAFKGFDELMKDAFKQLKIAVQSEMASMALEHFMPKIGEWLSNTKLGDTKFGAAMAQQTVSLGYELSQQLRQTTRTFGGMLGSAYGGDYDHRGVPHGR